MEEADAKRMMKVVHVCVCGRGEEGKILLLFAIAKVKGIKRCITVFVVFVCVATRQDYNNTSSERGRKIDKN